MPNMMTTAFPPAVPPEETGVVAPPAVPPPGMSTAPAPYQWGTQPVPGGGLPQAGSVPPSMMTGAFPSVTAPQDAGAASPPPETMMEAAPGSAPAPSAPAPTAPLPMTMAFSRSGAAIAPAAFPSTQEVLAKLSKPEPPKSEPPKAVKVRSKTPLIIIGAASAVVIAAAWFFLFRNAKDLKTAVRMDSGRPPVGSEMPEESAAGAKPRAAAAAPAPQAAQPAQLAQPVQPAKGGATAPAPAAQPPAADIRDERPAAITLVKEFPLDGERGSIAKWLQYSFAATPGTQNDEKWDAGAYEENTYAVKYMVQPAGKEPITYLFEADLANQMVKGMNAAAKDLLAGRSPAKAKAKAKARKAKKRAPRRRASPAPAKPAAVLPLPSDAELAPPAQPAQDDSAFRSDTVQPNF